MTRDDIIRMAREAGWSGLYMTYNEPTGNADWEMVKESLTVPVTMEQIERFAALVAAAEREECAKECDIQASWGNVDERFGARQCSHAIRSRGSA